MKPNRVYSRGALGLRHEAGVTLLDVVLAIAVFAFGMLALVQLQGNLTRAGADATTRSVAAGIAEEIVERLRAYRSVGADPDNGLWDYEEMDSDSLDITNLRRGGIDYDVDATVTHFWWDEDNETFIRTTTAETPAGLDLAYADFKLLRLDVSWDDRENYVDDDTAADLGSGSVTVYEIIPSSPPILGAKLATSLEDDEGPLVNYNPGDNPDIIALQLDAEGTRFKESTSATPTVFRDNIVETWFDVVTYSQALGAEGGTFLRREEFVTVSCECELEATPNDVNAYGLTPTLWNGVDYTEGVKVAKPIGTPVNNIQQSAFCTVCCRDHHDTGGGPESVYNLEYVGADAAHPHYYYNQQGDLVLATPAEVGDRYVEACRLVRKDGFMRVTQDVSQKTLIGFPEGYLEFDEGAANYSSYVIDAIDEYYGSNGQANFPQPMPPAASGTQFPARTLEAPHPIPLVAGDYEQQLRARSVYADYLTADAQAVVANCFADPPLDDCDAPNAASALEIYPFFDLQMTYLANWIDESANGLFVSSGPQSRFNQSIETDNPNTVGPEYDRGVVELTSTTEEGRIDISINSYSGNLGLTATRPINNVESATQDWLYLMANSIDTPVPPIGQIVSGALSSGVRRVNTADLNLLSEAAICGSTLTEWSCVVPPSGASLTISGYYLNNPRVYVCSDLGGGVEAADGRSITFALPAAGGSANIVVTDDPNACPGG